jgi:hypothetical protein
MDERRASGHLDAIHMKRPKLKMPRAMLHGDIAPPKISPKSDFA